MKRKALFVGVNEYEDAQIRDLNYSLSDAYALKTLFELFGYETDILENPAKSDVFSAVKKMTGDLSAGDLFFFYFAGHGWTTTSGKHLLFCKDDMYEDLRDEDAGISFNKLKRKTTGVYNRAFVLDACRSDFITGTRGDDTTTRDLRPIGELVKDAPATSSLAVLRSCSKYEHALEIESRKHGLFTLAMMDVLRASKESGAELLFGESLCDAVTQKMAVIARAEGIVAAQTPEFAKSGIAQVLVSGRKVPPPQHQQPAAALGLVTCPVCSSNVQPVGTHNCVKCGKKYVCADCWDKEYRCCTECAGKMREADNLLAEGKRCKERKDYREAAKCFRKAAALGSREACHHYGDMLLYGRGVEKDVRAALTYYQKCDGSDPWIQFNIGLCYLHLAKEKGSKEEGTEAEKWLQKSAKRGVSWAYVKLGDCYRDGIVVPRQDFAEAAKCYRLALEDKGPKAFGDHGAVQWAEYGMGGLYRNGQGVKKDLGEALRLFRQAAAREGDAADLASTAAAEVLPDVLVEREGDKLGKYWQNFRIIHGVQILDADGRWVPLAGLVASNRAIFVGVSLESLPSNKRNSFLDVNHNLPDDEHNPVWKFAQSISQHCGIPEKWFLATLVVPDTFRDPGTKLPSWAVRESDLVDAMLNSNAEEYPDWLGKRQDIIRKLEKLPMSSEGAEKNALKHFTAAVPEWEDGAALLGKVGKPSPQLIQLAKEAEERNRAAGARFVVRIGSLEVPLRWCPAGTFTMGSPATEEGRWDDEVQHRVTLTKGFWMGETEVTQGLWKKVMGGETIHDLARKALRDDTKYNLGGKMQTFRKFWNLSRDADPSSICGDLDDDVPVYFVNWHEAVEFCARLTAMARQGGTLPEGCEFRLPTEAQWEYACRAGTTTALPNGRDIRILGERNAPALDDIAWYGGNSSVGFDGNGWDTDGWKEKQYPGGRAAPRAVGTKNPNRWGLYDMIGNVYEWCADWYGDYSTGSVSDPTGPASGGYRVLRGGGWDSSARYCRSARRGSGHPGNCDIGLGFRLSCSAGPRGPGAEP